MNNHKLQIGAFFLDTTSLEDTPLPEANSQTNKNPKPKPKPISSDQILGLGCVLASLGTGLGSLALSLSPHPMSAMRNVVPLGLSLSIVSLVLAMIAVIATLPRRGSEFALALIGMTSAIMAVVLAMLTSMPSHQAIHATPPAEVERLKAPKAPQRPTVPLGDEFQPIASDASPGPSAPAIGLVTTAPMQDEGAKSEPSNIPSVPPAPSHIPLTK